MAILEISMCWKAAFYCSYNPLKNQIFLRKTATLTAKAVCILLWKPYFHVKGSMTFLSICRYKGLFLDWLTLSSVPPVLTSWKGLFLVTFLHSHSTAKTPFNPFVPTCFQMTSNYRLASVFYLGIIIQIAKFIGNTLLLNE